MSTDEIDALLERYLHLLDQYTVLRKELNTLQSSIYQDIARANFSANRGIRYGQDHYSPRLCASRLIQLRPQKTPESSLPIFQTVKAPSHDPEADPGPHPHVPESLTRDANLDPGLPAAESRPKSPQPPNPLRMFGVLVPPALRRAQSSAIVMTEEVLPQLASVDAEMREMEIRIRRARKYYKREREKGNVDVGVVEEMNGKN